MVKPEIINWPKSNILICVPVNKRGLWAPARGSDLIGNNMLNEQTMFTLL